MSTLTSLEEQLLLAFRRAHNAVLIGIDHHGDQLTVAYGRGQEVTERQLARPGFSWLPTRSFAQDGLGYVELLAFLTEQFPEVPREHFRFLSEPSYAKPLCHFLLKSGFAAHQVLWADTRRVSQFRKTHHLAATGKNDVDDARTMVAMLHHAAVQSTAPVELFELPQVTTDAATLAGLAQEYERLSRQGSQLKNRIAQLVMTLFPELRRVWGRTQRLRAPGIGVYERRELALFDTLTPLRLLAAFPSPKAVAEAGFEAVWKAVGGVGVKKATIQEVCDLAGQSGGLDAPNEARRLGLLVSELLTLEERKELYKLEMAAILDQDPVFASFSRLPCLGPSQLATIVGAIGDPARYRSVDEVKRYLNVAPRPMPQTGDLDASGRPVQRWRFPANSYETVNGQRRLTYRSPGRTDVRNVLYMAFENIVRSQNRLPDDPLVKHYRALQKTHEGRTRWFGRVRWKVASKLVGFIYHCWKAGIPYDPAVASAGLALRAT